MEYYEKIRCHMNLHDHVSFFHACGQNRFPMAELAVPFVEALETATKAQIDHILEYKSRDSYRDDDFIPAADERVMMSPKEASNVVAAMHMMSTGHVETRMILSALLPHLEGLRNNSKDSTMKPYEMASFLYGMNMMSSECEEVRAVLRILAAHMQRRDRFWAREICKALYGMGCMSSYHEEVRDVLALLVPRIQAMPGNELTAQGIGMAIYGMRGMDVVNHVEVQDILESLAPHVKSMNNPLDSQALGNVLYGMYLMPTTERAVRIFLREFVKKLYDMPSTIRQRDLGMAMYGVHFMSAEYLEIQHLFRVLASHAVKMQRLPPVTVAHCLYGMYGKPGSNDDVRRLLGVLATHIESMEGKMTPAQLGMAFHGMNRLGGRSVCTNSVSPELAAVLNSMARHVQNVDGELSGREIAIIIYGLQGMGSEVPAVCNVLASVVPHIEKLSDPLKSHEISQSLMGMQYMCVESAEVKDVVIALIPHIAGCEEQLTPGQLAAAMVGLKNMGIEHEETRALVSVLTAHAAKVEGQLVREEIVMVLGGLSNMNPTGYDLYPEVAALIKALTPLANRTKFGLPFEKARYCMGCIRQLGKHNPEVKKFEAALFNPLTDTKYVNDSDVSGHLR
jgi:hypothetical protein